MVRKIFLGAAALAMGALPVATLARQAEPVAGENELAGQGTIFFLAGIAAVALAIVLLPEDEPASP